MNRFTRVYAEINGKAFAENIKNIQKKIAPTVRIMPVIKADAYGHGAAFAAQALEPFADSFAVAILEEALELRESGVTKPIMLLGYTSPENYADAISNGITVTVFTREAGEKVSVEATKLGVKAKLHIALDTGMSRIGFSCSEEAADDIKYISQLDNVFIEGMFTLFATADEADKHFTQTQINRFNSFNEMLKVRGVKIPVLHAANSAAIMEVDTAALNMVRPGIILYGLYPSNEVNKAALKLVPVMSIKAHVAYVKEINKGDSVSYGRTFTAKEKMKVATIPVGYADGYPRQLSGKGRVIINGCYAPILGRVCMDQFMVDVTAIPDVKEGSCVTLIGSEGGCSVTADEIAEMTNTINYEVVCTIGKRVPRKYIQE